MEFSRHKYWSGLPFPSLGDLPDPGIELRSPVLAGRFFTTETPGKPRVDVLTQELTVWTGSILKIRKKKRLSTANHLVRELG